MRNSIAFIYLILTAFTLTNICYSSNDNVKSSYPVSKPEYQLTPFPNNEHTQKIIKRNELENEGRALAEQGKYDEAILKFKDAMNPSILNYDYEKGVAETAIINIFERQDRFEDALKIVDSEISALKNEKYPAGVITGFERAYNKRLELLALIKARDTKNNKPIYDYIGYLKSRYSNLLPPNGYATGFSDSRIDDIIHLYDYLHDYDAGIAFMDDVINYHKNHKDPLHRSAHAKDVREYSRVKQAWELDKKTGQRGHLKDVIRTSSIISW